MFWVRVKQRVCIPIKSKLKTDLFIVFVFLFFVFDHRRFHTQLLKKSNKISKPSKATGQTQPDVQTFMDTEKSKNFLKTNEQ